MNGIRKVFGLVMVLMLAAFSLPGHAAGNDKVYTLTMSSAVSPLTAGTNRQLTATFTNTSQSGGATFNALQLVAPNGYKITKVLSVSSGTPTPAIGVSTAVDSMKVEFTNPVNKSATFTMTFLATVPAACASARWNPNATGDIWNGSQIGTGSVFTNVSTAAQSSTTVAGVNSIALALNLPSGQSSVIDNTDYTATATVTSTCPGGASGIGVNFTGSAGVTTTPSGLTDANGVTTSTVQFTQRGPASLTASAPSLSVTTTYLVNVFDAGNLACEGTNNPPYPVWTAALPSYAFDGSPGVNSETDIKFFKGVRGANIMTYSDPAKNKACILLNYTLVNNVPGSGPDTTSQPGKTVPENAFALFYDDAAQPNATFRTLQTYRDEWTSAAGWIVKRTKVCVDAACATMVPLKACLDTILDPASMPFFDAPQDTTKKMPACVVSEVFFAVPVGLCAAPEARPGNAACVRVTSELIFVGDPVVPRYP